jgi:hypothetical protein
LETPFLTALVAFSVLWDLSLKTLSPKSIELVNFFMDVKRKVYLLFLKELLHEKFSFFRSKYVPQPADSYPKAEIFEFKVDPAVCPSPLPDWPFSSS